MAHPAPPPSCQETCPQEPCSSTGAVPRAWPDPPLRSKTASRVLAAVGLTNSTNYTWTGQSHRLDPRPYCGWSGLPRHCQTQASYLSKVCPPQTPTDLGLIPAQVRPPQTPTDPGLIPEPAPASSRHRQTRASYLHRSGLPRHRQTQASYLNQLQPPQTSLPILHACQIPTLLP